MYLLVIIVYLIGLVSFIEKILEKWGFYDFIQEKGALDSSLFIYKLTSCRFCLRFHLTWIVFLSLYFFYNRNVILVLVPFAVIGFINLLRCKK